MIDIHHHCLPGVDDGPREWDEAVQMCRIAEAEGITVIVVTPHVLRGRWRSLTSLEIARRVEELQQRVGPHPRLLTGSEYYFGHDMVERLAAGVEIAPLARSRYVLIELAANSVPPLLEQPLYRAQLEGWIPVIAHPERNAVFQQDPTLLEALVARGTRVQVTATSLTGEFGPEARRAAEVFLERRIVHFVASDAHNTARRPPRVAAALERLRALAGEEATAMLALENPRAVIENRALPWVPEPPLLRPAGLLTRLRSFFSGGQA